MPVLDLGSQSDPGRHPHAGAARLTNLFAEIVKKEQKSVIQHWPVAGLNEFATLTSGGTTRSMLGVNSELLVVSGRALFRVEAGGTATLVGGIASDGHVTMAQNGRESAVQVGIVCDGIYNIYESGTLTAIDDPDLRPPNSICYIGGYFCFTSADGRMTVSELEDGASIDGLDFTNAQSHPDGLIGGINRGSDWFVLGEKSAEVWSIVQGEADFPFARAAVLEFGCCSARSITRVTMLTGETMAGSIVWLATDSQGGYTGVYVLDGWSPRKISTPYLDGLIEDITDKASISTTSWVERGNAFIQVRSADWSLVYNTRTQFWHHEESAGGARRFCLAAPLGHRVIVGDATEGALYVLDPDTYDDAGDELVCTIQTPPLTAYPARIEVDAIWLDVIPGVGLATGADEDVDPQISMQWTSDGQTWSNELTRALGRQGATATTVRWTRLGTQNRHGRTYRFRSSAKVVRGILQAQWDGWKLPA
jgi:hypothetical protein